MILKTPLWKRTPPAIFPICLGYMGLGLAWRGSAEVLPIPPFIGGILLGLSTAFFLYFLAFYIAKLIGRPSVILDDLKVPPLRAGVAAIPMSMMLLAAALLPFNISVPQVWWAGVIMQYIAIFAVIYAIWKDPPEKRAFSPFMYLAFVGPVVGPIAGIKLGYATESLWLTIGALIAFVVITVGYGIRLIKVVPAQPLRPSLAIVLAPISLFAMSFGQLGMEGLFGFFYWFSWVGFIALVLLLPWMTKGGWTPMWGAITFPFAAFTNVQIQAVSKGYEFIAEVGVILGLAVATPIVFYVLYRATMDWVTGALSEKTGAAVV